MRKICLVAILLFAIGCSKNNDEKLFGEQIAKTILQGIIADDDNSNNESRVHLDDKIRIRWNKADIISVFYGTTHNKKFQFKGDDGDSGGDFENVTTSLGTGNDIDHIYALYPYNESTKYQYGENNAQDWILYPLSSEQTYKNQSIGPNTNLMVAITADKSDETLIFRNVCSYLRLKLYGENQKVNSIVFKGNSNEVLSGNVAITPVYGGNPAIKMLGNIEEDNKTITLNCPDGITVGNTRDDATEFWMVIPPLNFSQGFTITVYGDDDKCQEYIIDSSDLTFARNKYNTVTRELTTCNANIPNNQIWYTSSDGEIVIPNKTDAFGAKIVSNVYDNGKGVITFDGDVTEIGESAFYFCTMMKSVVIPESVTSIGKGAFYFMTCLEKITFESPNQLNYIGDFAFGETQIAKINIPSTVEYIGHSVFTGCGNLESIELGYNNKYYMWEESVLLASEYPNTKIIAFPAASTVETIKFQTFGSGTIVGQNSFVECKYLKTVEIMPIVEIESRNFRGCENLENIDLSKTSIIGENVLRNCKNLKIIDAPDVSEIGIDSFCSNASLTKISLGCDELKIINTVGNSNESLQTVRIPLGVDAISNSFNNCPNIVEIYCKATIPPVLENSFNTITNGVQIYVPTASVDVYKAADGWKDYADAIFADPSEN